jgi:hypothetical protein
MTILNVQAKPNGAAGKPQAVAELATNEISKQDRRKIIVLLEAHYKETGNVGEYNSGYSDQKISDELGVPVPAVVKVREENCAPLKPDADVVVRQMMEAMREEISKFRHEWEIDQKEALRSLTQKGIDLKKEFMADLETLMAEARETADRRAKKGKEKVDGLSDRLDILFNRVGGKRG